jgi:hypothetical protein
MNIPKSAKDWTFSVLVGIAIGAAANAVWAGIVRFVPRVSLVLSAEVLYFVAVSVAALFVGRFLERRHLATPRQRFDDLMRKHGIYIGSQGIAVQVICDTLHIRLVIVTHAIIEMRYIRVALNTGIGELTLESAEPHRIYPTMPQEKSFRHTLTAEQLKRVCDWTGTVTINGTAKFEGQIEQTFSFGSALSRL